MSDEEYTLESTEQKRTCNCGCGRGVARNRRFVNGHNNKNRKFSVDHRARIGEAQRRAWLTKRKRMPVGSRRIDSSGYVIVKVHAGSGRWVQEHILIMQRHLGRWMKPGEQVHHVNGDRKDNRISNLYVCRDLSHHQKVEWSAKKLLKSLMQSGVVQFNKDIGEYFLT